LPAVSRYTNKSGTRLTKALFYETTLEDKSSVVYTLKNEDHKGFTSLYRLYMEMSDPTEYRFATSCLADWEHWTQLCECTWFESYRDRWRQELNLKITSEALARILTEAGSDRREAFSANKYLLEKGWVPKDKDPVGRPSKEAIRRKANEIVFDNSRLIGDAERIGVKNNDVGS
jgi:hypothetical protein